MAIDIEHFLRLRPFAFHITARENLPALRRAGVLEPASELMQRAGRSDLLRWRRQGPVNVQVGEETVTLRDQAPLLERTVRLSGGWSFGDFIEYLNEHVYFWPGNAEGPIKSGLYHAEGGDDSLPLVIRIPTRDLLERNPSHAPLFASLNVRAGREEGAKRVRRGPRLFVDALDFGRRESEVIEIAFRSRVALPDSSQLLTGRDWAPLL